MSIIEKTISITVDITPKELAEMWCGMSSGEQAEFFNRVADVVKTWKSPFVMQLQYLTDSDNPALTDEARLVMEYIGEYARRSDEDQPGPQR